MELAAGLAPYIFAALALLLLGVLRSWSAFDGRVDLLLALLLSILAAVVAGSVDLGTDAPMYRVHYDQLLAAGSTDAWWEPGFEFIASLFGSVGAPYGVLVFTCVLTSHLIKLYVFNEMLPNRLLGFFILFCLNVGEIAFVRQYLAASLILLSFYLLVRNRPAAAVLVIVAATLIHKTALIVAVIVIALFYGYRSIKMLAFLALVVVVAVYALPARFSGGLQDRVMEQIVSYAAQDFVQGEGSAQIALARNVSKFFPYLAFAGWMMLLPARSSVDVAQRKAGRIVIALSVVSILMIFVFSPVFSRFSTYIFPFLAVSMRFERFRPFRSQVLGQYLTATLCLCNLAIALYPLVEYF